ncbi:hypothetical protein JG688_00013087 [Phytophthora aleatoria]|uniref:RxLR effector protein n=1 Tax=Phytophthora aleatoria TaxID=2496075 RepID=A0A8J5M492_9STRA|nr:hypothetical protein JG688_00013087 [Phytophthora aleatoria]
MNVALNPTSHKFAKYRDRQHRADDEEEERLSRKSLNTLLDGDPAHKFALWKGKEYSGDDIFKKLGADTHSDRRWIYNAYLKYLNN